MFCQSAGLTLGTVEASMFVYLCNCPPADAPTIARALVERGLAACVNLIPGVQSVYVWDGALCEDAETTLLIKTAAASSEALREALTELHPYSVPEIVALPVDVQNSSAAYVDWVRQTRP